MKIICTDGRFFEYVFPADVAVSPGQIAAMMRRNVQPDGNINSLCLDFAGSYLPLMHESEIRLASVLVATYHNAREREMALQASRLYSRAEAGGAYKTARVAANGSPGSAAGRAGGAEGVPVEHGRAARR